MTAAFERGRSPEKADKVRKLQSVRLRENANKGGEGSKIGNFSEHHKWNAPDPFDERKSVSPSVAVAAPPVMNTDLFQLHCTYCTSPFCSRTEIERPTLTCSGFHHYLILNAL